MSRRTSYEGLREDLRFLNVHGGLRDGRLDRICCVPRTAVVPSPALQDLSILRDPLALPKRPQVKCVSPIIIDVDAEECRSSAVSLRHLPQVVDRRSKTARKSQTAEFSSCKAQREHARSPQACGSPALIKIPRISASPALRVAPRYQDFVKR